MAEESPRPEPAAAAGRPGPAVNRRGRASSVQLTADELQQLKWLLGGALTLLSISTVLYMDVDALTLALGAALGVGAALVRPAWPARIPRLAHRLSFSFIAAFFTGDLWLTGELLPAIVRLDILLLLYRGITYRQRRDDLQIIVLGLFLIVLGGVLSVSLTFIAQILAFTAGALVFLLTITLAGAGEETPGRRVKDNPSGQPPAWARQVRWRPLLARVRQVTDWRVVMLGAGLFVGLVAVSALLFLVIPRFQLENSFFLERFITKKTKTGFSDTIRFGEVTDIMQDNAVALSVDVSDRSQIPASPYWRMLVLDEYRDGTFRLSPALRKAALNVERGGTMVRGAAAGPRRAEVYWTFYFESGVSRFLPLLGRFEVLRFREPQNYRFSRSLGVVELRSEPATMLAYRVEGTENSAVVPDEGFGRRWREYGDNPRAEAALLLRLGVDEPDRVSLQRAVAEIVGEGTEVAGGSKEVARSSLRRAGDETGSRDEGVAAPGDASPSGREVVAPEGAVSPSVRAAKKSGAMGAEEFIRRANAWLAQRHGYSLSPRIPAGTGDPLVRWLTSTEGGHCELFAGSLVLLARSAGLPARVVTGFRGGSWNGYSNNFTLRNADAHAWCEVFDVSASAWLRADPTPGSAATGNEQTQGEASLARRLDRSWTARLDSLRVFWYRRIVSFDQQSQLDTLRAVKTATELSGRRVREALARWAGEMRAWFGAPWTGGRTMTMAAIVAAVAGGAWAVWILGGLGLLRWRLGGPRRRGDAVRHEAGRWLTKLGEREAMRGDDEIVGELQRLRYGARETWPEVAGVFRRARNAWRAAGRRGANDSAERS